jgi:hypothetical protein
LLIVWIDTTSQRCKVYALSAFILKQAIGFKCCKERCCAKFLIEDIKNHRTDYHTKRTVQDRGTRMLEWMSVGGGQSVKSALHMRIAHSPVCQEAFCKLTGISKGNFFAKKHQLFGRATSKAPENPKKGVEGRQEEMTAMMMGALRDFIDSNSDSMPHLQVCINKCQK